MSDKETRTKVYYQITDCYGSVWNKRFLESFQSDLTAENLPRIELYLEVKAEQIIRQKFATEFSIHQSQDYNVDFYLNDDSKPALSFLVIAELEPRVFARKNKRKESEPEAAS